MAALYSAPIISKGLVFSLYTLTGMLLPGYALVNLLKIDCKTDIELIAYIIFFGYFVSFIQYFFVVPFAMQDYAPCVWALFSVLSASFLLYKDKKSGLAKFEYKDNFGIWVCILLFFVVLFIKCGLYAGINLLPYGKVNETGIHEDLIYWMENSIELTKRFPPYNYRSYGVPYNYHYFTSVQLATMSLATKISIPLTTFCFSYIQPAAMMVFGGYVVFSKCNKSNLLRLGAMLVFLFTAGFSDLTDNRYAGFMYEYPFAFDYGMAIFLFLTFLVMKVFCIENLDKKSLCVICVCFLFLCGIKANFAMMALVGIGTLCLRWIFLSKYKKEALFLGVLFILIFGIAYLTITNLHGYAEDVSEVFMKSNTLTNGGDYGDGRLLPFFEGMLNHNIPKSVAGVIFCIVFSFLSNPLLFLVIVFQIVRAIVKKESLSDGSLCLLTMVVAGVFIKVFVGMYGWSEQYFLYNVFPIGTMFALINWNTEFERKISFYAKASILGVFFVIGFYGLVKYDDRYSFFEDIGHGISRYCGSEWIADYKMKITKNELEAYEWLRDHTGREEFMMTNSIEAPAFTEVYQCPGISNAIFCDVTNEAELKSAIKKYKGKNANWAVIKKGIYEKILDFEFNPSICEIAFENEGVIIYRFL